MSDTVLFVMAGYPGAGKSTLLARAAELGYPLFGSAHSGLYARLAGIRDPAGKRAFFFTQNDLPRLDSTGGAPEHMVLEVDLVSIFSLVNYYLVDAKLLPPDRFFLVNRPPDSLVDKHHNMLALQSIFGLGFFRRFDSILVNTLYTPWHVCAAQWREREIRRNAIADPIVDFRQQHFFSEANAAGCSAIHRAIYDAWIGSMHALRPKMALVSRLAEAGTLVIDEIDLTGG